MRWVFQNIWTETLPSGLVGYGTEVTSKLIKLRRNVERRSGSKGGVQLFIGIILGTLTVFIIDRRLDKGRTNSLGGSGTFLFWI